jgi:hypothetical protein
VAIHSSVPSGDPIVRSVLAIGRAEVSAWAFSIHEGPTTRLTAARAGPARAAVRFLPCRVRESALTVRVTRLARMVNGFCSEEEQIAPFGLVG